MTPKESSRVIDAAGGNAKFAELLGLTEEEGYQQRIANWRRRGIPSAVIVDHFDTIQRLKKQLN